MNGWIKLHRQIQENEFYFSERFDKAHAWIDLILLAQHKPNTFYIRGNEIKLNCGETGYSILTLSKRWGWNQRTVIKFLKALENRQMIHIRTNHVTTIITILKWDIYQGNTEQSAEQNTQQSKNRIHTINNDKTDKKVKKGSHLFTNSPYYDKPEFIKRFYSNPEYLKYDANHYYEAVRIWSESNGERKVNWIATAYGFARRDKEPKMNPKNELPR